MDRAEWETLFPSQQVILLVLLDHPEAHAPWIG
jgi:hypothetical protein